MTKLETWKAMADTYETQTTERVKNGMESIAIDLERAAKKIRDYAARAGQEDGISLRDAVNWAENNMRWMVANCRWMDLMTSVHSIEAYRKQVLQLTIEELTE